MSCSPKILVSPGVRSARVDLVFSDAEMATRYLEVEEALALCLGEAGGGPHAHWGASTRDITDTASVLALRDILAWADEMLDLTIANLSFLANEHRRTAMLGRGGGARAMPTTFGAQVARWLGALLRHRVRLGELRPRLLNVQLGGPGETLALPGPAGSRMRRVLARQLGLGEPAVCWHVHREGLNELIMVSGLLSATLARISSDIVALCRAGVEEVGICETGAREGGPALSQCVIVAARLVRAQLAAMVEAMMPGNGQSPPVRDALSHTLAGLEHMAALTGSLEVHTDRMRENLSLANDIVYAEAVVMALTPHTGRPRAQTLVDAAVARTRQGWTFLDALIRLREVSRVLSPEALETIFDGKAYIDAAERVVADVLDLVGRECSAGHRES